MVDFDAAVRQPVAKARIQYSNPMFDTSLAIDAPDGYGTVTQVADGVKLLPVKYFKLGRSRLSDGHMLRGTGQVGAAAFMPTDAGAVPGGGALAISEIFDPRPVNHVSIYGDNQWNDYPLAFTVQLLSGGVWRTAVNETANARFDYEADIPEVQDVTEACLTITKWSRAYTYPIIAEFSVERISGLAMADIREISLLREHRVEGQGVPYGTMAAWELKLGFLRDVTLPRSAYRANVPITLQLGTREGGAERYVDAGVFYAYQWSIDESRIAGVVAHDWRRILADDKYDLIDLANTKTIGQLIDGMLSTTRIPARLWRISGLGYAPPVAIIPEMAQSQALLMLLAAGNGVAVMGADGVCTFKDDDFPARAKTLDGSTHIQKGLANPSDSAPLATAVEVVWYEYVTATAEAEVAKLSSPITVPAGQQVCFTMRWEDTNWSAVKDPYLSAAAISGGNFEQADEYTSLGIEVTVISIDAVDSVIESLVYRGLPVRATKRSYVAEDAAAIGKYGRIVYLLDNPLIQSYAQAMAIATAILPRYGNPSALWKWASPGDPQVLPGDVVNIPALDGGNVDVQVERQLLTFGGSGPGLKEEIIARER